MRLAMMESNGKTGPAVVLPDGGFLDLRSAGFPWTDIEEIIEADEKGGATADISGAMAAASVAVHGADLRGVRLLCPLRRPEKILCIGKNYADHCREFGSPLPDRPVLFAKYRNALSGPGEQVELPAVSATVDYEAELAAVIGKRCKEVSEDEALRFVFGYTCANDLTMRDVQREDGQWTRAKSPDGFCPVGPWIVTADEIENPQGLGIRLTLNGKLMQDSNSSEMVFGVAALISFLSQTMTLAPGDIVLTGTPAGVGMGRTPPVFLKRGDRVAVVIDGIGTLENPIK